MSDVAPFWSVRAYARYRRVSGKETEMAAQRIKGPGGFEPARSGKADPLAPLVVFDRLEVGPVELEPNRLRAPYRLSAGGKEEATDFVYRYEEDVFDPDDSDSINLASVMAAQVAINYGLFCREIVFHGRYEGIDRRFIVDMAQNTAREIYVKKFLEPNPFLIGAATGIPALKKASYVRAAFDFKGAETSGTGAGWKFMPTKRNRCAILSSGGKDSLLSFGLMSEIGSEVHPIFVNESGRHWFTALNAYRHFRESYRNTARVWVNSDRVFAWFLKRFPFVRSDFASVRSDEYPIRLWTVAIFVFGALPLVLKRGIGRLLIGDEYDTTERSSFKGITHYNGLYDQSRYFDNLLSRYYLRKGWSVSQFSVLRPLSEMLIEKILLERYPDLQRHQVSCHATHMEGKRVKPCGRCEKCRRIVGMLTALGGDAKKCGYTKAQVESCLLDISKRGVHQEAAGAQQMMHMLAEKGLMKDSQISKSSLRAHPEVMRLRFEQKRSPIDAIPIDLRKGLYPLYLQHADGAAKRQGRAWLAFDPLDDPGIENPFPFETGPDSLHSDASGNGSSGYLWSELTWPEAESRLKEMDVAILPVGSVEQHGPHLPLDTDSFDADYLAKRIAEACSDPKPLVLPLVPYGVSYEHGEFKGTIGIGNDTLARLVYEIGMGCARNGINKLVIINGHGGNIPALNYAAQMITRDTRIFVCVDTGETSDIDIYKIADTMNDIHAGEIETSTSLAVRPHLVKMDKAEKLIPRFSSRYLNFTSRRKVSWYVHTKKISNSGVIGDPTKASVEKGERMWQIMIAHLVALVEDLKSMTLDEIYQRRY
jgi:creatinine amidohydrolase/Fe(II)-dependent formamide hydrolase-like protein